VIGFSGACLYLLYLLASVPVLVNDRGRLEPEEVLNVLCSFVQQKGTLETLPEGMRRENEGRQPIEEQVLVLCLDP
jgi:hypothetical protein